ncbi:hypothetical protein [Nostoc sphaeroides]|uniref:hypothetical protein n=1 Tax=Nostoc sphaeroides TaxID=446679 RepID=UPI001CEDD708|nr:hypothetical protein [Nostoc sphaeroides]
MSAADNDDYSYVDQNFQPESLQTWGKRGSIINVEMRRYRESVLAGLVEDRYTIIDADDDESGAVIESVKVASEQLYTAAFHKRFPLESNCSSSKYSGFQYLVRH